MPPARGEAEQDEPEPEARERERRRPAADRRDRRGNAVAGGPRAEQEVERREEEADGAEDGPAGTLREVRDPDVHERRRRDERPVCVARVPPVQEARADEQTADEVEPERRRLVADAAAEKVRDAKEERHRVRPRAAVRDEVGDEEPADDGRDEGDEREPPAPSVVPGSDEDEQLEREMRYRPAAEGGVPVVEPSEPVPGDAYKGAPRDHR